MTDNTSRGGQLALLTHGALHSQTGGAGIRWRSLYEVLRKRETCHAIQLRCDRYRSCRTRCAINGGPPASPDLDDWYYSSFFCPTDAAEIASYLSTQGITRVICSGLETYPCVPYLSRLDGITVIYDMHNIEYPLWEEISHADDSITGSYVHNIRQAEAAAIDHADVIWTCSAVDKKRLLSTYPEAAGKEIFVVPNVVDVAGAVAPSWSSIRRVCFIGHLGYYPNVLAARRLVTEIIPVLRSREIYLPVTVAGADPGREVIELARGEDIEVIPNPRSVTELMSGSILAVPLTMGGGTRFKIVEAFSLGTPVVSTEKGVEGLDALHGVHYLRAETSSQFANAIEKLLVDEDLRRHIVREAWELVRRFYSIDALSDSLSAGGFRACRGGSGGSDPKAEALS